MKPFLPRVSAILLISLTALHAQQEERQKITEEDKQVFRNFKEGLEKKVAHQEAKAVQTQAVSNLRQIGLAFFEFETEYGFFPNAETAMTVKQATDFKGDLKSETANDCFFQLIVAGIAQNRAMFQYGKPEEPGAAAAKPAADRLEKCSYAYLPARDSAGHPGRPLVVAPLIKGTNLFDPKPFAGKAVVLRRDNSVSSVPIDEEGRAIIDGRDLFDPGQPYWKGEEPSVKWPAE
ncbi:MAG: hypothetical protein EOP88_03000 [Verrucomicrobiaceae bacterium]|nr:MAG: hypothetical protein EOP88_03000 [Verrucomicrobiaceae bacterium]